MSLSSIITIDIGNTHSKYFIKKGSDFKSFTANELQLILAKEDNPFIYVSSVTNALLPNNFFNLKKLFIKNSFLKMPIHYSPTLGIDRIVCSYYPFKQNKNCLVIDSGTFTTIDLVNKDGLFPGPILPGLKLLQSNYQKGQNLREHCLDLDLNFLSFSTNSSESISKGLTISFIAPIQNIVDNFNFDEIIVTGGNATALKNCLKSNTPVNYLPNLIHHSMHLVHEEIQ